MKTMKTSTKDEVLILGVTLFVCVVAVFFTLDAKMYSLFALSALLALLSAIFMAVGMVIGAIEAEAKKLRAVVEKKEGEAEPRVDEP